MQDEKDFQGQDAGEDEDERTDADEGQQDTQPERLAPSEGANVILANGMSPITVPSDGGPGLVNIGMDVSIELPSEAEQRAGFTLDERNVTALTTQYPGRYKRFKPKALPSAPRTEGQGQGGGEA